MYLIVSPALNRISYARVDVYPSREDDSGVTSVRQRMLTLMRATLADERAHGDWTYWAMRPRPMPSRPWRPGDRIVGDCSKGAQFIAWWAEGPDPMGQGFGAYGNSQTMTAHLHHLDHPGELHVGDYVTFGYDGDDHATVVMESGADPLLWSFGHQGAPDAYRLSYDRRQRYFLRNPASTAPPTPQEKLRAKTGYWPWLQWRLGEGAWKHYGKSDPKVRPNVPKRIPLRWWRRYFRFLRNRRSGNAEKVETPTGSRATIHAVKTETEEER